MGIQSSVDPCLQGTRVTPHYEPTAQQLSSEVNALKEEIQDLRMALSHDQVNSVSVSDVNMEDSVITVLTPEEMTSNDLDDLIFPSLMPVAVRKEDEKGMDAFLVELPGKPGLHTLIEGEQKFLETPVTFTVCGRPQFRPCGVRPSKPSIWASLLTIILFMNSWSQGLVNQTFAAPPSPRVNETLSPMSLIDPVSDPTHLLARFLSLSECPYLVRCVRGGLSEACPGLFRVSEVCEYAVHVIPGSDVPDRVSVRAGLAGNVFLPPSFVILPCRVLVEAEMNILRDSALGRVVEKGVFPRKFLRDVRRTTVNPHPNFFLVNLHKCSTIVSAEVLWPDNDVVCVAESGSNFCALSCGPSPVIPLTEVNVEHSLLTNEHAVLGPLCFLTMMEPTCSTGILDYCVVSPTGFVVARLFFESPPDEVTQVVSDPLLGLDLRSDGHGAIPKTAPVESPFRQSRQPNCPFNTIASVPARNTNAAESSVQEQRATLNSVFVVPGPRNPLCPVLSEELGHTQEFRQLIRLIESAEPMVPLTERHLATDSVVSHIPSEVTGLNHDFTGQRVCPPPNRQEVSHLSHKVYSTHCSVEKTLRKVLLKFFWPKQSATDFGFVSQSTYSQTTTTPQVESVPMMPISVIVPFDVVRVDVFRPLVPITVREDYFISIYVDYRTEWDVEHFGLTSDLCLAYLVAPLLSLSCVTGHCVARAYVAHSAQRPQHSQKVTTNFRDHFAEGAEINPAATVEVVPKQIRGCIWSPFVPTLTSTTNLFCFKGLEDNWADTSDYSDRQLSLPDRDSTPKSQSSRGGEGSVAGRNKTTFSM
ncbi:MAG: hypothetical protein GY696_08740, partial [Gammaproteobacteria bacterium]|nr:hypothetical protein [Gammaproteobacteria bacterium]